jgi:peroxiredoxin
LLGTTHGVGAAEAEIGNTAPDFTLPDVNGKDQTLSAFGGKFVVLEWVNHDCPFVRKHYDSGNMQKLQKQYTAKGVVWLSINSSAPGKQGHFSPEVWKALTKEKNAQPTAVLLDPEGNVGRAYGAQTTPHMYVINPSGELVYMGGIDDRATADPADIPASRNFVRMALDEAMAGKKVSEPSTKSYGCSVKY